MPLLQANGIELCFEENGARDRPTVLLLHGIGCQLIQWPDTLLTGLLEAGFHVLRMDNRDAGLSEKLDRLGSVDMTALMTAHLTGRLPSAPYGLADMAEDAAALAGALGKTAIHVVGVSMGGMIGQRLAIHHPRLVTSLTSIMSSSGAVGLPPPDPAAIMSISTQPLSTTRDDVLEQICRSWDLIGGPYYKSSEVGLGRFSAAAYDRAPRNPTAWLRQMTAIMTDVGRAERLADVRAPTLVLHGDADRLVPLACGEDTARRIPGARFERLPRMGHDLPEPLLPTMLNLLIAHLTM